MPYILQEELAKSFPHKTGCEAFDSMYRLYNIFQDPSYFLINLFFSPNEKLNLSDILLYLESASKKYGVFSWVVRCKQQPEKHPIAPIAFANISKPNNIHKCAEYILQRLSQNYDCVVHEVISGPYPSNRLDWLYSFGIYYKNSLPQIEIYPGTDASSIKWGKLSPLDLLNIDSEFNITHTSIRDPLAIETYRQNKLTEWEQLFTQEIEETCPNKKVFCHIETLQKLLQKEKHPLFDLNQIDEAIKRTQKELVHIALKYSLYAQENHINSDQTIIHGSLLFNNRIIVWDISTDQRWQHLKNP